MVETQRRPPGDPKQVYLDLIARTFTPEEFRDHLLRLGILEEFGAPADFKRFVRDLGSPEEIRRRQADMHELLENQRFFARMIASSRAIAVWVAAIGGGLAALRLMFPEIFGPN